MCRDLENCVREYEEEFKKYKIEVTAEEEGSWIEFKLVCDECLDHKKKDNTEVESFEGHIHNMRKTAWESDP